MTKDICQAHGNNIGFNCHLHCVGLWFPSHMLLKHTLLGGISRLIGPCFMYTCRQGIVSTDQSLPMLLTQSPRQAPHHLHLLISQSPEELEMS